MKHFNHSKLMEFIYHVRLLKESGIHDCKNVQIHQVFHVVPMVGVMSLPKFITLKWYYLWQVKCQLKSRMRIYLSKAMDSQDMATHHILSHSLVPIQLQSHFSFHIQQICQWWWWMEDMETIHKYLHISKLHNFQWWQFNHRLSTSHIPIKVIMIWIPAIHSMHMNEVRCIIMFLLVCIYCLVVVDCFRSKFDSIYVDM